MSFDLKENKKPGFKRRLIIVLSVIGGFLLTEFSVIFVIKAFNPTDKQKYGKEVNEQEFVDKFENAYNNLGIFSDNTVSSSFSLIQTKDVKETSKTRSTEGTFDKRLYKEYENSTLKSKVSYDLDSGVIDSKSNKKTKGYTISQTSNTESREQTVSHTQTQLLARDGAYSVAELNCISNTYSTHSVSVSSDEYFTTMKEGAYLSLSVLFSYKWHVPTSGVTTYYHIKKHTYTVVCYKSEKAEIITDDGFKLSDSTKYVYSFNLKSGRPNVTFIEDLKMNASFNKNKQQYEGDYIYSVEYHKKTTQKYSYKKLIGSLKKEDINKYSLA